MQTCKLMNISETKDMTDSEIVLRIQERNEAVTKMFYDSARKYFKVSYRAIFSRADLMDDIFQQSFVKLWMEIETRKIFVHSGDGNIYRRDRDGAPQQLTCNLQTFLIDIAKNDYRTWVRTDRLALEGHYGDFAHLAEALSSIGTDETADTLREQVVSSCVADLPPRCKDILTMFYYKNMTLDEIVVARGESHLSKNGVKTAKYKCMTTLKAKVLDAFRKYNLST